MTPASKPANSPISAVRLCAALIARAREPSEIPLTAFEAADIVVEAMRQAGYEAQCQLRRLDINTGVVYFVQAIIVEDAVLGMGEETSWNAIVATALSHEVPAQQRKNAWTLREPEAGVSAFEVSELDDAKNQGNGQLMGIRRSLKEQVAFAQAWSLDDRTAPAPRVRPSPRL